MPRPPHERYPEYEPTHGEIMDRLEEVLAGIREIKKRLGR